MTGQYYLRARFYNPVVGRFTQEDAYRCDGLNLYAYVGNNPVNYVDPSGYAKSCKTSNPYKESNADGKPELQQIIDNLDSIKGGSLGNVDNCKFIDPSFRNKILDNIPDIGRFKDRTVSVIGHKESIVPFQHTKGLNNRINVFKAKNFGPDYTI